MICFVTVTAIVACNDGVKTVISQFELAAKTFNCAYKVYQSEIRQSIHLTLYGVIGGQGMSFKG